MTSLRFSAAIGGALLCCVACNDSSTSPPKGSQVTVTIAAGDSLFLGRSLRATASATSDTGAIGTPAFAWTSSDTTVAIVDSAGNVLGVGVGQATLSAATGGRVGTSMLRVVLQRADGGVSFTAGSYSYAFAGQCAISAPGTAYCRALASGGDTVPQFEAMPGATGIQLTSIHTALNLQCGLATTGMIYCWGQNSHWQFGSAQPAHADAAPVPVSSGALRFSTMTLGGHSGICAVSRADNVLYCWGHNDENQLGRDPPVQSDSSVSPVTGSLQAIAVSTSNGATCALDMSGMPYCWGLSPGDFGVSSSASHAPTPAPVTGGLPFTSLSKGESHTCALTSAGDAYCWGRNTYGELGIGTLAPAPSIGPQRVLGGLHFASVSTTYIEGTCGITTDGDLYCWGRFAPYALADRLGTRAASPYQIAKGIKFRALSRDLASTCGVTTDERILCW